MSPTVTLRTFIGPAAGPAAPRSGRQNWASGRTAPAPARRVRRGKERAAQRENSTGLPWVCMQPSTDQLMPMRKPRRLWEGTLGRIRRHNAQHSPGLERCLVPPARGPSPVPHGALAGRHTQLGLASGLRNNQHSSEWCSHPTALKTKI